MHGRLTRQILSDPTYVVEIVKRRTTDVIDMAYHSLDSYLSHLKTHRDTQLHKETMTGKIVLHVPIIGTGKSRNLKGR